MEKNKENTMITENEQRAGEKGEHKIYLTLPPIRSKAGFEKMISNLKEAGAKFDSYNPPFCERHQCGYEKGAFVKDVYMV